MGRIYQETNDQHFHLVIFDYNSDDIDIENSLKQGLLQRYTLIRKTGKFIKTKAYNEAVSLVKDPNAIVFLLDLHLEIASDFLDNIRKVRATGITALQYSGICPSPNKFAFTRDFAFLLIKDFIEEVKATMPAPIQAKALLL